MKEVVQTGEKTTMMMMTMMTSMMTLMMMMTVTEDHQGRENFPQEVVYK